MYPVLIRIGSLTIYTLGLMWALGACAGLWILRLELKRYRHDPEIVGSVVFAAAIAGLVGARLLLILEEWQNFTSAPFDFIFSGSGFSWYGGLIGGAIGNRLDAADQEKANVAAARALESVPAGQSVAWRNPDSGNAGAVTPMRTYQTANGQYCREYTQTINVGGEKHQSYGTACRQADGTWKIVS